MKYLVIFSFLLTLVCNSGEHKHDHDHDHSHDHNHKEENSNKKSIKAHQHGVGVLNIVKEENILFFEFELPGYDVVGFEYKAKKKDDIKKVKQALNLLSDYTNMIEIDNSAECKKERSSSDLLSEGNHTEFRSSYKIFCSNIKKIDKIKIKYFENFRNSKKLNVKVISEKKAKSLELNSKNPVFSSRDYF